MINFCVRDSSVCIVTRLRACKQGIVVRIRDISERILFKMPRLGLEAIHPPPQCVSRFFLQEQSERIAQPNAHSNYRT